MAAFMLKMQKSAFDSKIFGCNVYTLHINTEIKSEKEFKDLIGRTKVDILFCSSKFFNNNITLFEKLKFSFTSIRSIYTLSVDHFITLHSQTRKKPDKNVKIVKYSTGRIKISSHDINNLARVLIRTSRYSKDKNISPNLSLQVFIQWIQNSLYHHFADEVFLATKDNKIIGIISFKIKRNVGYIDLICILPSYQKRGIGSLLLKHVVDHLQAQGISSLITVTQGENLPASVFYQKSGFIIKDIELVYHKHFKID